MKYANLIKAYAAGEQIECYYVGWPDWVPLVSMRSDALRTFLGIEDDSDWSFRIKE